MKTVRLLWDSPTKELYFQEDFCWVRIFNFPTTSIKKSHDLNIFTKILMQEKISLKENNTTVLFEKCNHLFFRTPYLFDIMTLRDQAKLFCFQCMQKIRLAHFLVKNCNFCTSIFWSKNGSHGISAIAYE